MNHAFIFTPYPKLREAVKDLEEKIRSVDFEPNLAIVFVCSDFKHGRICSLLSEKFGCNVVILPAEGYASNSAVWMRGAACVLLDAEHEISVFRGSAAKVCDGLSRARKHSFNFLIYPPFNFTSRVEILAGLLRLKKYEFEYSRRGSDVLEDLSEYLENKFVYPINRMIGSVGATTVSLNIFPVEIRYGHPVISVNGRKIGRGAVLVSIDEKIESSYSDMLPERGRDYDETVEILRDEFRIIETVKVDKRGVAVGYINQMAITDFLRKIAADKRMKKTSEIDADLVSGKFFSSSPYGLGFVSEVTNGTSFLGIINYPLKLYPSIFDLDVFSDMALFLIESYKKGWEEKVEIVAEDIGCADLMFIDQNLFLLYRDNLFKLIDFTCDDFLAIFTSFPGYSSSNLRRRYMSEVEDNICMNLTSTIASLRF